MIPPYTNIGDEIQKKPFSSILRKKEWIHLTKVLNQ